ncbi:hypothetical protein K1719_006629 [Acacia pycnantha]|nr:hypothetical protein K1719_006629 [Acacia pycnantha]
MIGKMIKVDRSTSIYDKGGFARICVEIDLKQPLLPTYMVFGEERPIIYEGLHHVCFTCGKYGHQKNSCPLYKARESPQDPEQDNIETVIGDNGEKLKDKSPGVGVVGTESPVCEKVVGGGSERKLAMNMVAGGGLSEVTGGDATDGSMFGKIRILRREFYGHLNQCNLGKGIDGAQSQTDNQRYSEDKIATRMTSLKKEKSSAGIEKLSALMENKGGLTVATGSKKSEWVPVGSKRKNGNKGKAKGKDNFPPGSRVGRIASLGHSLQPNSLNSFVVLNNLEAQLSGLESACCEEQITVNESATPLM